MGFLKRREVVEGSPAMISMGSPAPCDLAKFPALVEFLHCEAWPDGSRRQTGTLLVFVDEGRLKACLSDRDQALVGFVTGESLEGLIRAVEEGLQGDHVDWRPSRVNGKGRRR
jgi:hypothetical protein